MPPLEFQSLTRTRRERENRAFIHSGLPGKRDATASRAAARPCPPSFSSGVCTLVVDVPRFSGKFCRRGSHSQAHSTPHSSGELEKAPHPASFLSPSLTNNQSIHSFPPKPKRKYERVYVHDNSLLNLQHVKRNGIYFGG